MAPGVDRYVLQEQRNPASGLCNQDCLALGFAPLLTLVRLCYCHYYKTLHCITLLLHGVKIIAGCDYIKGMYRCRMQRCRMTVPEHVCLVTRAAAAVPDRLMSATFSAEEKV